MEAKIISDVHMTATEISQYLSMKKYKRPDSVILYDPLIWALSGGDEETIVKAISEKSIVNHAQIFGQSPLHIAVVKNLGKIVNILLSKGALIEATDGRGMTPIMLACRLGNEALFDYLLDKGASLLTKDNKFNCCFYLAAHSKNRAILQKLMDRNICPTDVQLEKCSVENAIKKHCDEETKSIFRDFLDKYNEKNPRFLFTRTEEYRKEPYVSIEEYKDEPEFYECYGHHEPDVE